MKLNIINLLKIINKIQMNHQFSELNHHNYQENYKQVERMHQDGSLASIILYTKKNGYFNKLPKQLLEQTLCLHAMREDSILGGKENYFTTDFKIGNETRRGPARLLWSCDFKGNEIVQYNLIGIVNPHKNNVLYWEDIPVDQRDNYIKVEVTKNLNSNFVGVKKIKL